MADVAGIVVPLFGLVLLGGLAGQSTVMARNGRRVVDWLLLRLALPALVFDVIANAPSADLGNWPFFLTLTFGTYCAFAIAFTVSALRHGGDIRTASVDGAIGSHGALTHIGPALILLAFGQAAALPLVVVIVLDALLIRLLLPALWAVDGRDRQPVGEVLKRIWALVVDQPMFPAALAGAALAFAGIGVPLGIDQAASLLGSAAAPLGLIGLGLALASIGAREGASALQWNPALVTKLVVHPIVVYLLLSWAGNFDDAWMYAALLIAAVPPAAGLHTLARGNTRPEPMDNVAATGVIASGVSITLLAILIFEGVIPADPFY
jgi:predicted permease